ncbi:hypothetical protein C8246_19865 [Paracidovorax avenae]|uniref:Ulp1 family type III secretion system effector isopeptidase XopD n=2 Tax=Paracidovorax avenae TaxID=80867 RepID=UPI000D203826|nr:Ulp1 family type III secretion system effector isopeptidase XopD [Paracidovorax avenae]AVS93637.1 hypothetical protein C8246_19865 [Paracidovorax avenae]AVT00129.1 hypothetical protein C8236_15770 [Paracidovorax avenae]
MDNFFNFDINSYRRMTAAMDEPNASPPSPRNDGDRTQRFHMHPLRDALPSLEIAHSPIQSSVHRMRAPAPQSTRLENHPILFEALPHYGNGENWQTLQQKFPGIGKYLTPYGITDHTSTTVVAHLNSAERHHLKNQATKRIEILYSGKDRDLAIEYLEDAFSNEKIREKTQHQAAIQEEKLGVTLKSEREFFRKIIEDFLEIIDRFEAGEAMKSLSDTIPNINSYIKGDGYTKKSSEFIKHLTPREKERIDRAFENRAKSQAYTPSIRKEPPPQASKPNRRKKLNAILATIKNNPHILLEISQRFSDPRKSAEEVCGKFLTQESLEKLFDRLNGDLTETGELVISNAEPHIQAAIRANFKLRFQNASPSAYEAPAPEIYPYPSENPYPGLDPYQHPYYGQHYLPPSDSFFSGFSDELQRKYPQAPATPQYPPATPTFSDLVPYQAPYYGQHYVPPGESIFSGFSGELQRRGYHPEPATPQYPQISTSTFDLSSLNEGAYSARDFDLNTPSEVTQPWLGDGYYGVTPATSPERIDVDALPSPQEPSTPAARPSGPSETEWLGDEHLIAYMGTIADRLEGLPNAELLNFANPLLVGQLIQGDRSQRQNAMHQIMARGGPIIFLPVNDPNSHWSLLVIDQRNGDAFHYDSLVRPQDAAQAVDTKQYELARDAARAMDVYTPVRGMPIARQRDGHSCGDHVLQAMDMLAHSVVNGTFGQPHTMDLSGIETDRGLIADTIANASAARAAEAAPAASRMHERPAKKSKKWWKF